jgi:YHS domain-containing protein
MKQIFFALTIACALTISAAAHDKKHETKQAKQTASKAKAEKVEFKGKGDGVETCPVSGDPITSKDVKGEFFGRTVYFCCPDCLEEAKKTPAAYIKKTHAEQLAAIKNAKPAKEEGHDHHATAGEHAHHEMAQDKADKAKDGETKFLGKGDGIETCPVTGEPVNKNLKGEVNGQVFYVCCEDCLETVKKNPSAYLKKAEKK